MPADATSVRSASIHPAPTAEEAAAIVAAVEALWPQPRPADPPSPRGSSWRFSGRWWSLPVPVRRDRPWH